MKKRIIVWSAILVIYLVLWVLGDLVFWIALGSKSPAGVLIFYMSFLIIIIPLNSAIFVAAIQSTYIRLKKKKKTLIRGNLNLFSILFLLCLFLPGSIFFMLLVFVLGSFSIMWSLIIEETFWDKYVEWLIRDPIKPDLETS